MLDWTSNQSERKIKKNKMVLPNLQRIVATHFSAKHFRVKYANARTSLCSLFTWLDGRSRTWQCTDKWGVGWVYGVRILPWVSEWEESSASGHCLVRIFSSPPQRLVQRFRPVVSEGKLWWYVGGGGVVRWWKGRFIFSQLIFYT